MRIHNDKFSMDQAESACTLDTDCLTLRKILQDCDYMYDTIKERHEVLHNQMLIRHPKKESLEKKTFERDIFYKQFKQPRKV